jgi:hypothetical protein
LDFSFFGLFKHLKVTADGDFDKESANNQIIKLLQTYEQTIISSNIPGSFSRAGLHLNTTSKPFKIRFVEQVVRENPDFYEL